MCDNSSDDPDYQELVHEPGVTRPTAVTPPLPLPRKPPLPPRDNKPPASIEPSDSQVMPQAGASLFNLWTDESNYVYDEGINGDYSDGYWTASEVHHKDNEGFRKQSAPSEYEGKVLYNRRDSPYGSSGVLISSMEESISSGSRPVVNTSEPVYGNLPPPIPPRSGATKAQTNSEIATNKDNYTNLINSTGIQPPRDAQARCAGLQQIAILSHGVVNRLNEPAMTVSSQRIIDQEEDNYVYEETMPLAPPPLPKPTILSEVLTPAAALATLLTSSRPEPLAKPAIAPLL